MGSYLNRKRNRFMSRFLLSHLLILFVPLVVFTVGFRETSQMMKRDTLESNLASLDRTKYVIDQSLSDINKLVDSISTDPNLQWLLTRSRPLSLAEYTGLYESTKTVQALYNLSAMAVYRYYIIYPKSGIILSPSGTYNLDSFYGYAYSVPGLTSDEWLNRCLVETAAGRFLPSAPVVVEGKEIAAVTYLRSIPVASYGEPQAMVLILIDADHLLEPLSAINTQGGNACIADAKGQIIVSTHPDPYYIVGSEDSSGYEEIKLDGTGMLHSWVVSGENGFQYSALARSDAVMLEFNRLQFTVIVVSLLCLVGGIAIAWALSYVNAKPLREIISTVRNRWDGLPESGVEDYKYLKSAVSAIVESDHSLRQQIQSSLPMARTNFVGQLLRGEIADSTEADSLIRQLELDFDGRLYNSVIVGVSGYSDYSDPETLKELNTLKALLKSVWEEFGGSHLKWYSWDINEQAVAFLTIHREESPENCARSLSADLEAFGKSMELDLDIPVFYEYGAFCDNLIDVYVSFGEAKVRAERRMILGASPEPELSDAGQWIYYYPLELEQRIVNVIKAGNRAELLKILDLIYEENFRRTQIPEDMGANLFSEIRGTIFKVFRQLNIGEYEQVYAISSMLKKIKLTKGSEERFRESRELILYLCDITTTSRETGLAHVIEDIRHYIQAHYTDSNLSLTEIASHFQFSDPNFSYFFKEHFRENFSVYLERIRIEAACASMEDPALALEEIAIQVGYNSAGSFRRAFKRVKGIIPSEYKKMYCETESAPGSRR
ncbi:helix-turn-helix domain-containing protein [Ruminococcaceae bacterium OttesenSCG-928-L11]|nr:helix-turn-helix domain-containing protein [Ruminococcaceae bacterium OttesenSCG-928-L11]